MQSQRKPRPVNTRFVVRGLIVALVVIIVILVAASFLPPQVFARLAYYYQISLPPPPTPPPPTLMAPRGALPSGPVGLVEKVQLSGGQLSAAGSGFLLRLEGGPVIGVTTAHSMGGLLGSPPYLLQKVAFSVSGQPDVVVTFDRLYGPPGVPFSNQNLAADYVLLKLPDPAPAFDGGLALAPDPRGAPEPGEQVVLFSGLGDGQGNARPLRGSVLSVEAQALWVVMDEAFDAGGMSGSPLLSEHTGQVVGMAMAVMYRRGHTMIGFHPIGSLVQHAQAATAFPLISEYRR